ncbi:MAG TPA: anti-sigma factor [Flavobacteriaceae bacterium]|nr:anti-sigma factor [Flavobacteriaceae bacterium]
MNVQEYITSGILELYIYGALSDEENREISKQLHQYPEIQKEVEEIESALQNLSEAVAPYNPENLLASIREKMDDRPQASPVVEMKPQRKHNWPAYIGWAASIALLIGLFAVMNENRNLRNDLQATAIENAQMEEQIADARENEEKTQQLLEVFRSKEMEQVELAGQKVAPNAYATVIWDATNQKAFIDAQGLPEPPPGKVYQVWSLTLNPLSPTSIGLLENFEEDDNKIFVLSNPNNSQAFGITLEPAGGSKTPTMEQLYTLGVVGAS